MEMIEIYNKKELRRWLDQNEKIYIYGAGKIAKALLHVLEIWEALDKVKAVLVTDMKGNEACLNGIPVFQYDGKAVQKNIPVLITVFRNYAGEVIDKIAKDGCNNYRILSKNFDRTLDEQSEEYKQQLWVRIIEKVKNRECEKKKVDIMFITPPYWDLYSPFSAVPCLVAAVKQAGFTASQYDIGIHCIHNLLDKKWKKAAEDCLSLSFYEKNIKDYIGNLYTSYEAYYDDMDFLKEESYDVDSVKSNYTGMNAVQKRVVDAFYSMIYEDDTVEIDFDRCKNIHEAIDAWNSANLLETIYAESLEAMLHSIPQMIGISITSMSQFVPGCVLAKLLKECRPDVNIVMGGSCADVFVKSSYQTKSDISTYFDYIIIGEGETAIVRLLQAARNKEGVEKVPNLALINSDNNIRYTEQIIENVDELPMLDYEGLNLDLYLAPEIVLPYQTSRGCHYGHCAFCNHDEKYRHNYRSKSMDKVVKELRLLSEKHQAIHFQFVDEAIRPDCFEEMIEEMDKHLEFQRIKWFYYSRVSRYYNEELLHKAKRNGCEMVMFGVETFNQRLLSFIKKGINAETSKYCLELFHKCGIKTYAWMMCNLPSETIEEAQEDLRTVQEMSRQIDAFSVGPFYLYRNTDMYADPAKYNIVEIDKENGLLFQSHNDGKIIDKESMLRFFRDEYLGFQRKQFAAGNRYTLFFE